MHPQESIFNAEEWNYEGLNRNRPESGMNNIQIAREEDPAVLSTLLRE